MKKNNITKTTIIMSGSNGPLTMAAGKIIKSIKQIFVKKSIFAYSEHVDFPSERLRSTGPGAVLALPEMDSVHHKAPRLFADFVQPGQ